MPDRNTHIVESDLLIIGGGSAGLWAAKRFTELLPEKKVVIVDKGPKEWGGLMSMAGGDFDAVLPGDDLDAWIEDFVYYFDGLCDQEQIEEILRRSNDRLEDYQRYGCEFFRKEDGTLKSIPQRGLPHVKLYPAKLVGRGGEDMVRNLVKQLRKANVTSLGRIVVTDLLKQNGRVVGAVGFDSISGDFYRFRAQVVIASTGVGGWKTSYGKNTPTGEGVEMVWNAGVRLKDFEFSRVWNMPRYFGWEGQTKLIPLGAHFVNAKGEPFMEKYSPVLGVNTDPHFITIAMAMEIRAGRGPIYFDISRINPDDLILLRPQNGWQLMNYEKLCKLGMDLFRDNTEWLPQMTISYGGMEAGIKGTTNVEGLFAAGTARSTEPGVYAGGFALMTTSVTGHLAGEGAAEFLASASPVESDRVDEDIDALRDAVYAPLGREGLTPHDVLRKIQTAMFPYDVSILKTEASLTRALDEIVRIREEEIPNMAAADPHYLLKLREIRGMALVSELYLRASLERRESRAGHFREDFPNRAEDGLAWILIQKDENGAMSFSRKRVPLERYRHPITRYYQDNFRFVTEEH
ncbi:FAD-binding protein [uncultured Mailhella sp.]|uniref:FAD-binding protein n=1 Tax=uncultured Mailhella sp. TaxID=1981031 RepID=UPI0025D2EF10|nr:FAD-binding protein [uncultured Mailhella sp.]